jgi:hypothetical protein
MDARQRVGAVLVVGGVVLALVSGAGILMRLGAPAVATASPTPATASPTAAASPPAASAAPAITAAPPTSPPVTSAVPTSIPTQDDGALVRAFFVKLQDAVRAGSQETMVDVLGQATIDRYGRAACVTFLTSREPAPEQVFEILSVHEPAPWEYVTDERTTTVPDATTVDARVTGSDANGVTSTEDRSLHVQVVDGVVRWFTDCGDPLG